MAGTRAGSVGVQDELEPRLSSGAERVRKPAVSDGDLTEHGSQF